MRGELAETWLDASTELAPLHPRRGVALGKVKPKVKGQVAYSALRTALAPP